MRARRSSYQQTLGITLVELMILSAIIAILVMIVAQNIFGINNEGKTIQVRQNLRSIQGAINVYHHDMGQYPTNEEGLSALIVDNSVDLWNGPYLNSDLLIDPWGEEYHYELGEKEYRIYTFGEDKKEGGSNLNEDIILSNPKKE